MHGNKTGRNCQSLARDSIAIRVFNSGKLVLVRLSRIVDFDGLATDRRVSSLCPPFFAMKEQAGSAFKRLKPGLQRRGLQTDLVTAKTFCLRSDGSKLSFSMPGRGERLHCRVESPLPTSFIDNPKRQSDPVLDSVGRMDGRSICQHFCVRRVSRRINAFAWGRFVTARRGSVRFVPGSVDIELAITAAICRPRNHRKIIQ